jgi:hypothetical protein
MVGRPPSWVVGERVAVRRVGRRAGGYRWVGGRVGERAAIRLADGRWSRAVGQRACIANKLNHLQRRARVR